MFGAYKKYTRQFTGVLTGKGREFGGSLIRPEATGYGNVYFLMEMLRTRGTDLQGKTVLISGSGNVAQYTAEKVLELGGKVLTMSDSDGFVYDPDGIDRAKLDYIMELKNLYRGAFANMPRSIPRHNTSRGRNLGASSRHRPPSATAKRTQRRTRTDAARQRRDGRERRGQHALHPRSGSPFPVRAHPLCARQGGECRRCFGVGSRDEPELGAPFRGRPRKSTAVCTKSWKASTRLVCNTAPRLTVM